MRRCLILRQGASPISVYLRIVVFVADALFCWHEATILGACGTGRLEYPVFVFAGGVAAESTRMRGVDASPRNRWTGFSLANTGNPHRERAVASGDFATSR